MTNVIQHNDWASAIVELSPVMNFSPSFLLRKSALAATLLLGVSFGATGAARADVINVPNFSFETDVFTDTNSANIITNWTRNGSAGTFNPGSSSFTGAGGQGVPPGGDGAQSAFVLNIASIQSSASLAQVTANTNYSLTVAIGQTTSGLIGTLQVGFLLNDAFVTGSSATFAASTVTTAGRFQEYTFNFTPTTNIGDSLKISLGQTTSTGSFPPSFAYFDNVRLTSTAVAPVPEPSTWAMMALGVGAISLVSRKRKRAGDVI